MKHNGTQTQQRGVALIVALFVLAIMSTILIVVLADVRSELKMSGIERNSERALKIAEAGVNIARASFLQEGIYQDITSTQELASVDGFIQGGYFFTHLGSGFPGNEKWVQWHYDAGISGNNNMSEVTTPLRRVWQTGSRGRNGSWRGSSYYVNNIYAIIAGGAYFPIEQDTTTFVRAHDEYTGSQKVKNKGVNDGLTPYWGTAVQPSGLVTSDKSLTNSTDPNIRVNYAVRMSPMASYSNLSTIPGEDQIAITEQTIYLTYAGSDIGVNPAASTVSDYISTVRLRASNALNNPDGQTILDPLWEFDTGIHGIGTAPAFFDPSPEESGDEIIYFAVVGFPEKNSADTQFQVNLRGDFKELPSHQSFGDEQIYLFAIIDTSRLGGSNRPYIIKWARPFPDPDVIDWTDYPTEHATGTNGFFPPYVRVPSDMTPFLPEDDVLFDYRDGEANNGTDDSQHNQVRGNVYMVFDPQSLSPPVLSVTYRLNDGTITADRIDSLAGAGNPADPNIDIYLAFAAHSRVTGSDVVPYSNTMSWSGGILGNKKQSAVQTRVIALRDRLAGACDNTGLNCTWNWNSARSRFPTYKWSYRVPSFDPKDDDQRPWNGYGEFTWETWFEQQVAPMITTQARDQDGAAWTSIPEAGQQNLYTVVYPAYESLGFVSGGANYNNQNPPTTGDGAPVAFDTSLDWDESRLMIMGIRDTWEDYMAGNQTNSLYTATLAQDNPFAMMEFRSDSSSRPVKSNPVEPYWTHKHDGVVCNNDGSDLNRWYDPILADEELITYPQYAANADKIGFPRPAMWSEPMFQAQIKGDVHPKRNLDAQGWKGLIVDEPAVKTATDSDDLDVEGETSAFCAECLNSDGLMVTVFNHDVDTGREDLRVHGTNSRTGVHVWDYHMPAKLAGDYFNATPGIANNRVFVAYQRHSGRKSLLQVLSADNGAGLQRIVVDDDSDVVVIPPSIANGAVYVGSYDFNGDQNFDNDVIRIFAFSPVLRIFSTGIYPMSTSLSEPVQKNVPRTERKLQVWISGAGSKWEEVREVYQ